jgi:hypothetical protein
MIRPLILQEKFIGPPEGKPYEEMIELTRARNEAYCKKHHFDYSVVVGPTDPKYSNIREGGWDKIKCIIEALMTHNEVVWLDSDAIIRDLDTDLRGGFVDGIGVCWHRYRGFDHWNTGVMYIRASSDVMIFLRNWLDAYPGTMPWMEQGVFNTMAMSSKIVQTISDRWNATLDCSMVPDAVVLGFHGFGLAPQRYEAMKQALVQLEAK